MGIVNPIPLRVAEKVIQRTFYVTGRAISVAHGADGALGVQVDKATAGVMEQRWLRYNQPVVEAVDSLMKEKLGWW